MSGNGGNPHSLRDLLGTYEKSGLSLMQQAFAEIGSKMGYAGMLYGYEGFVSAATCSQT